MMVLITSYSTLILIIKWLFIIEIFILLIITTNINVNIYYFPLCLFSFPNKSLRPVSFTLLSWLYYLINYCYTYFQIPIQPFVQSLHLRHHRQTSHPNYLHMCYVLPFYFILVIYCWICLTNSFIHGGD